MKHFLLICSLFLTIPAVAETTSDKADTAPFKQQLDTCWQTFKKDYETKSQEFFEKDYLPENKELLGKSLMSLYNQQQKICADAFQCYQKVADQIFDTYYPHKKEDMKKYLTASIDAQINLYGFGYAQNKLCFPSCGLMSDITSQIDTFKNVHVYLLNVLDYTDNISK